MTNSTRFVPLTESLPENGAVVEVLTPGMDVRPLLYRDGMWWLPDGSMYVYFTPSGWRALTPAEVSG